MTALFRNRAAADAVVDKLKTYAQPQRLMILSCLLTGEHTVSGIDAATGIGQPALSQQLAELRRAGMVKTRRASKQVYYDLADGTVRHCVQSMEAIFGSGPDVAAAPAAMPTPSARESGADAWPAPGAAGFAKIG